MKTKELIEKNAHISIAEIKQDIADTETEIYQMKIEAEYLEKTPLHMRESKLNYMRASAKKGGIKDRQEFIKKLKIILESRN